MASAVMTWHVDDGIVAAAADVVGDAKDGGEDEDGEEEDKEGSTRQSSLQKNGTGKWYAAWA